MVYKNELDEIVFFIAPKLIGGPSLALSTLNHFSVKGISLKNFRCEKIGSDLLLRGYVHRSR